MMSIKLYGKLLFLHGLSDGTAQLIGAGGVLEAATDAFQTLQYILDFHAFYQSAYTLCVAVAAAIKLHVFQNAVLNLKFNCLTAGALGSVCVSHI